MSTNAGERGRGVTGYGVSANEYSCAHGAQKTLEIKLHISYLTYDYLLFFHVKFFMCWVDLMLWVINIVL
jgi:hypothetical protein